MNQFLLKRSSILLLLCGLFFFFGNNLVHLTDPDEAFYSLTAKEMTARQEWLTPYIFNQPQFEKPVLTFWLMKVAFAVFGQTPFAARFFSAVFASLGVLAVYALGLLGFGNERKAFLAALVLCTSAFYLAMGKTVFTDMIFAVLVLYALLSFYLGFHNPAYKRLGILSFYFFAALAVLTKGPLGFLIPVLIVVGFLLYRRQLSFLVDPGVVVGFFLCLLIAVPWYWYMIAQYGQAFIREFFYNDHWRRVIEAEHRGNDHWFFYPLTMIGGLFPWSLFLAAAVVDLYKRLKGAMKPFEHFLLSWMLVVFVIFQLAHSKLASYILPMFPALALLTANFVDERIEQLRYGMIKKLSYVLIGFLTILGIASVAAYKAYKPYVSSMIPAYWLSASLLSISGISLTLLFKDKIRQAVALLSFCLVPVFLTAFMISSDLEPYISMYEPCLYVPSAAMHKTTILVAKAYARGVHYYTDQDVAVMDLGGQNYFSPHPIPILNTKEKLLEFLHSQPQIFAILKKSYYQYLTKNYADHFDIDVLKIAGVNYILKIEPRKPS
ncbi:MAG: glycosyltransferase family 39 protein [Candidatus Omnitrophica bacterium]|nr:glycosyltransferase family 39 protein [Candidatus Omnitrophota bacterium]